MTPLQSLAQGSGAFICQRTVGEYSLSSYGSINSVKRPVRTRMLGVVGAGGLNPPATRLGKSTILVFQQYYDIYMRSSSMLVLSPVF